MAGFAGRVRKDQFLWGAKKSRLQTPPAGRNQEPMTPFTEVETTTYYKGRRQVTNLPQNYLHKSCQPLLLAPVGRTRACDSGWATRYKKNPACNLCWRAASGGWEPLSRVISHNT